MAPCNGPSFIFKPELRSLRSKVYALIQYPAIHRAQPYGAEGLIPAMGMGSRLNGR